MNLHWQPSASLETLRKRASFLKRIRDFFAERNILEVETPLLCHTSVTDPFIHSIQALFQATPTDPGRPYYLQTSPEYAMKRLLASEIGAIYQLTKAFRQGEIGRFHQPEFTLLEWYRPGFDHHRLMDEVDEFLQSILNTLPAERKSYAEVFRSRLGIDPHHTPIDALASCAKRHHLLVAENITDHDTWLNLLMTHCIEPTLGENCPCFIYDFPASQAALARIQPGHPPLACRFEVYVRGIELANGFHELQDAHEQRKRFEENLLKRRELKLPPLPLDEKFLSALEHGLPDCAGVALGIDRLIMIALQCEHIREVVSFDFTRV